MKGKHDNQGIKWIHLSDIHIFESTDYNMQLHCYKKLAESFKPDFMVVSGDFRHLKYNLSFKAAAEFLEKVIGFFHISKRDVFFVPGNHDVDKDRYNKQLRLKDIIQNADSNPDIASSDVAYLQEAFLDYEEFVKDFYGDALKKDDLRIAQPLNVSCVPYKNMNILLLNTALASCDDKFGENKELVDMFALSSIKLHNNFPIIAIGHHAPENLVESQRKRLPDIFKQLGVSVYMCGDAHKEAGKRMGNPLFDNIPCIVCGKSVIQQGDDYSDVSVIGYSWDYEKVSVQVYQYGNVKGKAGLAFHKSPAFYDEKDRPFSFNMPLSRDSVSRKSVNEVTNNSASSIREAFHQNRANIRNELILPWMSRGVSFDAVFPQIFVEPIFESAKRKRKYSSCSDLIRENFDKNIIITGEPGSGKSTLLKYIYLFKNDLMCFLYIRAMSLLENSQQANDFLYIKYVQDLFDGIVEDNNKVILLDCIDEVYQDKPEELNVLISKIQRLKNIHVWLGWREEHLNRNETNALTHIISDKVILKRWTARKSIRYVNKYAKVTKQPKVEEKFNTLIKSEKNIISFAENPFQLTLLVYLLESPKEIKAINQNINYRGLTLYLLYKYFMECWIEKEHMRSNNSTSKEEILAYLGRISKTLYFTTEYVNITSDDPAIYDLFIYLGSKGQRRAIEFCHRSFSAYFIANNILDALKKGGIALVEVLLHPLKDDVTVFIKSASQTIDDEEIVCMQNNMVDLYESIIHCNGKFPIENLSDNNLFCIKNGIVYIISRIKEVGNKPKDFLRKANADEKDPYMRLTIAYGAATLGIKDIALEYAKEYSVHSLSSFVTRSCSLAYYGDVQSDPYKYKDDGKAPWKKSRDIRLQHLLSNDEKDIRFRILDIPLLYCFYASRNWVDVNWTDLKILKSAKIKGQNYSEEEEIFLAQEFNKLILEYKKTFETKIFQKVSVNEGKSVEQIN